MGAEARIAESQGIDDGQQAVGPGGGALQGGRPGVEGRDRESAHGIAHGRCSWPDQRVEGIDHGIERCGGVGRRRPVSKRAALCGEGVAEATEQEFEQGARIGGALVGLEEARELEPLERRVDLAGGERQFFGESGQRAAGLGEPEGEDEIEGAGLRRLRHAVFCFSE